MSDLNAIAPVEDTRREKLLEQFDQVESAPAGEMVAALHEAGFTSVEMRDRTEQYLKIARQDLSRMKGRLRTKAIELLGDEGFESWISAQAGTVARLAERQVQPTHIRAVLR